MSGDYDRYDIQVPPPESVLTELVPGVSTLEECLAGLGAPLVVRELGWGAALGWGARRDKGWNVSAAVPVGDASAEFQFSMENEAYRGVVLFFDSEWILTGLERGFLTRILPETKARPQDVDLQ